jgi:hypothetical protein
MLLALALVLPVINIGCASKPFDSFDGIYGADVNKCDQLLKQYPSKLSRDQIAYLKNLELVETYYPSLRATCTLITFSQQDPSLKTEVEGRIPLLLANGNPGVRDSAVIIAEKLHVEGFQDRFRVMQEELSKKHRLTETESFLKDDLDRNLGAGTK